MVNTWLSEHYTTAYKVPKNAVAQYDKL